MKIPDRLKKIFLTILPAFLAILLAVMSVTGIIGSGPAIVQLHSRPFIYSTASDAVPQTLAELLNVEKPSLDALLTVQKLSDDLLAAGSLTDVVNSRLSLHGLRSLRDDAAALIAEREEEVLLFAGLNGFASFYVRLAQASAGDSLPALQSKMNELLAAENAVAGLLDPQIDLRGVWTADEKALLRWIPHGSWIPEQGFDLYRTIDGQPERIGGQLGSLDFRMTSLDAKADYAELFTESFDLATLTDAKLQAIGAVSAEDFAELAYPAGKPNNERARVSGEVDFDYLGTQLLTVPGTLAEKLPATDAVVDTTVQVGRLTTAVSYAFSASSILNQAAMAVRPMMLVQPYSTLSSERSSLVAEIIDSRQAILAKAFTDMEFAVDAGLGFVDDLSGLSLPDGTNVTYRLETPEGLYTTLELTTGQETAISQPAGLDGFGVDNLVELRWQAPLAGTDRDLIAGYWIERKKDGENSFKRLNTVPVAISYSLDETGVFFESPSFYEDRGLINGESAVYRIQALDIFGRVSTYSDELAIEVYKVTPPSAPSVEQPMLSAAAAAGNRQDAFYKQIADLNGDDQGIILPVSKASADTAGFVIYRADALGSGHFGEPAEIARVALETTAARTIRTAGNTLIINPKSTAAVDLAFFDGNVAQGYSYKYWAASYDTWGNESAWSTARVQGVQADGLPAAPKDLKAELLRNDLPDMSLAAPGFGVGIVDRRTLTAARSSQSYVSRPDVSDIVLAAGKAGIQLGVSSSSQSSGAIWNTENLTLSSAFGNLPDLEDVHAVIAINNNELRPDSSALVKWKAFSGSGLAGYQVYRAEVDDASVDQLQALTRAELLSRYAWRLVKSMTTTNQLADLTLTPKDGRVHLYLVCLVPEKTFGTLLDLSTLGLTGGLDATVPGGWVRLTWSKPDDPQVSNYRIYRAEVENFETDADPAKLAWNLVGDSAGYGSYTEKVDQTYAHYYYYKVASVDIWGQESQDAAILAYRVAATSPPQTPSMLVPLAQKGQIQVNWAGVAHADRYVVYRSTLPKISEADLYDIQANMPAVYNKIFSDTSAGDSYLLKRFTLTGGRTAVPSATTPVLSADKFNTLQLVDPAVLQSSISQISSQAKLELFRKVADKYGPLALRSYSQLSEAAARLVLWENIGEVQADSIDDPMGAYSYTDKAVRFGDSYYYTVQAVNDDDLASARPMPVSSSPRKSQAFDPVNGLSGKIDQGKPLLSWSQAKDANLTWVESREFVAGYIVYRSTSENGDFYQASPLLSELSWRDTSADAAAYNWYKVKVVDTAGYLSDFSAAVLVRSQPQFEIIDRLEPVILDGLISRGSQLIVPITPRITPGIQLYDDYEKLTIGNYTISKARLLRSSTGVRSGSGYMTFGNDEYFEVKLTDILLGTVSGVDPLIESRILRGEVSLEQAVYLPASGVTFTGLALAAGDEYCVVDGYLQSPSPDGQPVTRNLMGDLYDLPFQASNITAGGRIYVGDVPGFRYGQLIIAPSVNGVVDLVQSGRSPALVSLTAGTAVYHLDLETLDNSGLSYNYRQLTFLPDGQMSGQLTLDGSQTLRLVIPAGLGLRAAASTLTYAKGAIDPAASSIQGKVILPFTTFDDTYVPPSEMIRPDLRDSATLAGFDRFLPGGIVKDTASISKITQSMTQDEAADLNASITYLASRVQATSLLVLPADPGQLETLSTVPYSLTSWDGHGLSVAQTTMTPANVGNAGADTSEAIGVTPGRVALDLDRGSTVDITGAPDETREDFWVGIVVKEGRLALPSAFIKQDNGARISFGLTAGELLYDLNGFSYQNLIYNPEGTPVDFGEKLGSFRDVKIYDCTLDLYGNHVNLEMNGELGIPLFNYEKGKIKLYTNKDGDLVCTMAATPLIDPSGTGEVQVTILGGSLMPDGLHVSGTLDLNFADSLTLTGAAFNELIIPADMASLSETGNPDQHFGVAQLDQPETVMFHDFPMEIRAFSFASMQTQVQLSLLNTTFANVLKREFALTGTPLTGATVKIWQSSLTLWGGLQLSDNIALNVKDDFDRIVIDKSTAKPALNYGQSVARLDFEFEEFIQVGGVVSPVPSDTDAGYVEYTAVGDKIDMAFNTICDLAGYSVHSKTRFGYDYENSRYFFALGSYYDDPSGISFYYGKMKNINGVIGYNVDLPKSGDGRFAIPKGESALFDAVSSMPVDRTPGGNYFFASTVILEFGISYQDATIKIVEVRDCYIVVEKGPSFESGGDLYTPLDLEELVTEGNFTYTGYTRIGYYHPQRLFQFESVIEEMQTYSLTVSGSVGCEMNPVFWELRIGYPDALQAKVAGLADAGFGIMFRSSDVPDDSYIKARIYFNFDAEGSISIVYVRGWLYAGAEGLYEFDAQRFVLDVWLNGGVEGGIKVKGKRFNIISLMLSAEGQLVGQSGQGWHLGADARIYYSLDLWLTEYEGSVNWHISTSF